MTVIEAIQFFIDYGNIKGPVEKCLREKPSVGHIRAAAWHAQHIKNQPEELVQKAEKILNGTFFETTNCNHTDSST